MVDCSSELNLRDEIARLQQLVQEKDALLAQQQQHKPSNQRSSTYGYQAQKSIILNLVIPQFVGASEYCFLAGVSRGWRAQQLRLSFAEAVKKGRTTDKLRTFLRAALTTAARLRWAFDSGLTAAVFDPYCNATAVGQTGTESCARRHRSDRDAAQCA
jgi:hypothetical protein